MLILALLFTLAGVELGAFIGVWAASSDAPHRDQPLSVLLDSEYEHGMMTAQAFCGCSRCMDHFGMVPEPTVEEDFAG